MRVRSIFPAVLAVSLAGCAATIPPVEVTRFHLGQEIPAGPVRITSDSTLAATPYVIAVSQAMTRLGFSDVGVSKVAPLYTATISKSRLTREEAKRSPISIGIGGGTSGRNVGVGVGTSIGLGGGVREIIVTRLSVQIKRASDQQAIWEGRAETEAPAIAPASQPGLAAEKLANALFRDFPGVSGTTITVP